MTGNSATYRCRTPFPHSHQRGVSRSLPCLLQRRLRDKEGTTRKPKPQTATSLGSLRQAVLGQSSSCVSLLGQLVHLPSENALFGRWELDESAVAAAGHMFLQLAFMHRAQYMDTAWWNHTHCNVSWPWIKSEYHQFPHEMSSRSNGKSEKTDDDRRNLEMKEDRVDRRVEGRTARDRDRARDP